MHFQEKYSYPYSGRKLPIIYRIFFRMRYAMYSLFGLGLIFLFIEELRLIGVLLIVSAVIGFILCNYIVNKTEPEEEGDFDENGNARPNYK